MPLPPVALPPARADELLAFLLSQAANAPTDRPAILVVCKTRAAFMESLAFSMEVASTDDDMSEEPRSLPQPLGKQELLVPILMQVINSKAIRVVFITSVVQLRVWLAVLDGPGPPSTALGEDSDAHLEQLRRHRRIPSQMFVYGTVELHRDGSEWSAQGLANTISSLVEAGVRCRKRVVLVEDSQDIGSIVNEPASDAELGTQISREEATEQRLPPARTGFDPWCARLPMLNGTLKWAGFGSKEGSWRTVEVKSVLSRWFVFRHMDWKMGA